MPIGKDSITKRVAKVDTTVAQTEKVEAPVKKETEKAAPKTTTKKTTTTTKKPSAKKPATVVVPNIAPETVEKVVGHKENTDFKKVELGSELPYYLL